jgi:hypothetical protein
MAMKKLDHDTKIEGSVTRANGHTYVLLDNGTSFCLTCFLDKIKGEIKDKVNFHRTCDKPKNMCLGDISIAIDDAFNKAEGGGK